MKNRVIKIFILSVMLSGQFFSVAAQIVPSSIEKSSELYRQMAGLRSELGAQTTERNLEIWSQLATVYEQIGDYFEAAAAYSQAALLSPPNVAPKYILGQARCSLFAGDVGTSQDVLNGLLQTGAGILDEKTFAEVKLLNIWCDIAKAPDSTAQSKNIALLRSYVASDSMESVRSACLYTLWWLSGDEQVKNSLQRDYPKSPEAALIDKEATLMPSAIWFLTARKQPDPDPDTIPARIADNSEVIISPDQKPLEMHVANSDNLIESAKTVNTDTLERQKEEPFMQTAPENIPQKTATLIDLDPYFEESVEPATIVDMSPYSEESTVQATVVDMSPYSEESVAPVIPQVEDVIVNDIPNTISSTNLKPPPKNFIETEDKENIREDISVIEPTPIPQEEPISDIPPAVVIEPEQTPAVVQPTPTPKRKGPPQKWQQVGLFREENNAKKLLNQLSEKGFKAEILYRERETGIFYVVAVKDKNNTMKFRLQKAGFESYSIVE
ncbi:MAG: SPOR domain-containing protein [Treponemataceae bacterium]